MYLLIEIQNWRSAPAERRRFINAGRSYFHAVTPYLAPAPLFAPKRYSSCPRPKNWPLPSRKTRRLTRNDHWSINGRTNPLRRIPGWGPAAQTKMAKDLTQFFFLAKREFVTAPKGTAGNPHTIGNHACPRKRVAPRRASAPLRERIRTLTGTLPHSWPDFVNGFRD